MFRFETFEEEHLLSFLRTGLLDEYIEELLKRFALFSPLIQYELLLYLRERLREVVSPKVLARYLRISTGDSEKILFSPAREFEIILTGGDFGASFRGAQPARGFAIPETSRIITNLSHLSRKLRVVREVVGSPFAVFSDTFFHGDSFMLPLAVALSVENIPRDLRFTGKLNQKGDILEVEHLQEKISYCREKNLRLIAPPRVKHLSQIVDILTRKNWAIPFYITSAGEEEFRSFLKTIASELGEKTDDYMENLELFFGLGKDCFFLTTGQIRDHKQWMDVSRAFYEKLYRINNLLSGTKLYHLGMRGPVSLSFALGVLFSHFYPFVFYHYQTIEGITSYHPIRVLSPRILKERVTTLEAVKFTFERHGEDLIVVLNFSHHEPVSDVRAYAERHLENPSLLVVETDWKGNLPIEKFIVVARETSSLLQNIRAEQTFRSFHFFFSCPIPIAFMVGLAFGHYVDGWIYNYQKEGSTYDRVIDFRTLRQIREENVRI